MVLGFVPNIDEYMSAADILVTKAGPGSIAEAMIKGLPCLLTSFVPGQEEGNVDFVTEARAGEFVDELDPWKVAEKVAEWFQDSGRRAMLLPPPPGRTHTRGSLPHHWVMGCRGIL